MVATGGVGSDSVAPAVGSVAPLQSGAPAAPLQSGDLEGLLAFGAFFLFGLWLVYSGFRTWQRKRLMQDTPTEKVRSAAAGRTELEGTGHPVGEPLERPFGGGDCLVAGWEVEEYEHDDDGSDWRTVDSGTLVAPFTLDDGTGTMRVEPTADADFKYEDGHRQRIRVGSSEREPDHIVEFLRAHTDADVPPSGGVSGFLFGEDRRYTQWWIPVGTDLYVLGGAEPVEATADNTSGMVLRRDGASGEFIVSELTEAELVSQAGWTAPAKIAGGIALSAVMLYLLLGMVGVA